MEITQHFPSLRFLISLCLISKKGELEKISASCLLLLVFLFEENKKVFLVLNDAHVYDMVKSLCVCVLC